MKIKCKVNKIIKEEDAYKQGLYKYPGYNYAELQAVDSKKDFRPLISFVSFAIAVITLSVLAGYNLEIIGIASGILIMLIGYWINKFVFKNVNEYLFISSNPVPVKKDILENQFVYYVFEVRHYEAEKTG